MDAPERIWAWCDYGFDGKSGGWSANRLTSDDVEYLRADLAPDAALVAELVEAARPFAEYMNGGMDKDSAGEPLPENEGVGWVYLNHGHFRRLAAVLAKLEGKANG